MNCHRLDSNLVLGSIFGVHWDLFQLVQNLKTVDEFAENRVFEVKTGLSGVGEEELGPVGVGARVGH